MKCGRAWTRPSDKSSTGLEDGDLVLFAGCQGMDYGAKCALEHLSATIEADKLAHLKKVMEDRIAGV